MNERFRRWPDPAVLEAEIDTLVSEQVNEGTPGLAVLVAAGGKVLVRKGYGLANLETGTALEPDMRFLIASVTKQFTCTCIMLLAQEGLLYYDEPVGRFFPDFPSWGSRVTLRHLMTNTGGVPTYLTDEFWQEAERRLLDQDEILRTIAAFDELEFEPGKAFRYSDSGYVMLGRVIELLSDMPLADFMADRIFTPLGMHNTSVGAPHAESDAMSYQAVGYTSTGSGSHEKAPYGAHVIGWADGGMISNADDLLRWDKALAAYTLLPPDVLAEAFVPANSVDADLSRYGFGWIRHDRRGVAELWHGGGTPGFQCRFSRFPRQGVTTILLSNTTELNLASINGRIALELLGSGFGTPNDLLHTASTVHPASLSGAYRWVPNREAVHLEPEGQAAADLHIVCHSGDRLRLVTRTRELPLVSQSSDRLLIDDGSDYFLDVIHGPDQNVSGFRLDANGLVEFYSRKADV